MTKIPIVQANHSYTFRSYFKSHLSQKTYCLLSPDRKRKGYKPLNLFMEKQKNVFRDAQGKKYEVRLQSN